MKTFTFKNREMKIRTLFTTFILAGLLSCNAQKSEVRDLTGFDKIKISGALSMIYTGSDTTSVSISADPSDLSKVSTRVENSTLIVSTKGHFKSPVLVNVKNNKLNRVESSGATEFKTNNQIKTDSISLDVSGASNLKLNIETNTIRCLEEGAASISLEGNTNHLSADVSGAASLKAYKLIAKSAVIDASGAASVKINVTEKLQSTASGASDVKIKGDPKEMTAEASSAANISKSKETAKNKEKENCDTTYYNWKKKKICVYSCPDDYHRSVNSKQGFRHWAGFSMASSGYVNPGGGTMMTSANKYMELDYGKSLNYQFNLIENQINLSGNRLKIISGFGFDYHSYAFANKTTLEPDSSYTSGLIDSTDLYAYRKNKFRATYIQVPLLLEYNSSNNPKKTFHIAIGVIGQFLVASQTKQVIGYDYSEYTKVRKDSYNLSPFAAKAHVNFGYNNWTFFAEYSLSHLFQSGKGPELYPFAVGLRIIPFNVI